MPATNTPPFILIHYPEPDFNIRIAAGKRIIFDKIRKKFISLTPEEWVRQNFIQYLIKVKNYPGPLMAVEKEIHLGELKKRCDIVIYKNNIPWMIVECKEPTVPVNEKTFRQILGYNIALKVKYLILTNGDTTFGVKSDSNQVAFISALPEY